MYAPSCLEHRVQWDTVRVAVNGEAGGGAGQSGPEGGVTLQRVLGNWFFERDGPTHVVEASCGYAVACNPTCYRSKYFHVCPDPTAAPWSAAPGASGDCG